MRRGHPGLFTSAQVREGRRRPSCPLRAPTASPPKQVKLGTPSCGRARRAGSLRLEAGQEHLLLLRLRPLLPTRPPAGGGTGDAGRRRPLGLAHSGCGARSSCVDLDDPHRGPRPAGLGWPEAAEPPCLGRLWRPSNQGLRCSGSGRDQILHPDQCLRPLHPAAAPRAGRSLSSTGEGERSEQVVACLGGPEKEGVPSEGAIWPRPHLGAW